MCDSQGKAKDDAKIWASAAGKGCALRYRSLREEQEGSARPGDVEQCNLA